MNKNKGLEMAIEEIMNLNVAFSPVFIKGTRGEMVLRYEVIYIINEYWPQQDAVRKALERVRKMVCLIPKSTVLSDEPKINLKTVLHFIDEELSTKKSWVEKGNGREILERVQKKIENLSRWQDEEESTPAIREYKYGEYLFRDDVLKLICLEFSNLSVKTSNDKQLSECPYEDGYVAGLYEGQREALERIRKKVAVFQHEERTHDGLFHDGSARALTEVLHIIDFELSAEHLEEKS